MRASAGGWAKPAWFARSASPGTPPPPVCARCIASCSTAVLPPERTASTPRSNRSCSRRGFPPPRHGSGLPPRSTAWNALHRKGFAPLRPRTFAFGTSSCHSFHHAIYLRICTVTCAFVGLPRPCAAGTFRSLRAAGAAESGNRGRDPWESRKANWAHLLVRLGQLTSCAGGEARGGPKPNERVLRPGNQDGCERLLGALEPEGPTVAGGFGFRRAEGPSGSSCILLVPIRDPPQIPEDAGLVRPAVRGYRSQVMAAGQGIETNARRGQIVDVAMRQFAEHGYRGAHVEDIAAEVGVAKGTVFLHFGN